MTNKAILTDNDKKMILTRAYTTNADLSATEYLIATKFQVGMNQETPTFADTAMTMPVPITPGTANDTAANALTGSNGGDNTTDSTLTFKYGGGATDDTAQNLIVNATSATKTWTVADLTVNGVTLDPTLYGSAWLYIKDQTTLDLFATTGEAVRLGFGTDASNYYYKTWTAADLTVGWNWLTTYGDAIQDLTAIGTPATTYNYFKVEITTNNARNRAFD